MGIKRKIGFRAMGKRGQARPKSKEVVQRRVVGKTKPTDKNSTDSEASKRGVKRSGAKDINGLACCLWESKLVNQANFTKYTTSRKMCDKNTEVLCTPVWLSFFRLSSQLSTSWNFPDAIILGALKKVAEAHSGEPLKSN